MKDLRKLCRCGHVVGNHKPACVTCYGGCKVFSPAYPVFDDALPPGVVAVRELPSGLTIVECHHGLVGRDPHAPLNPWALSWCGFCFAEAWMTNGFELPVKRLVFAPAEARLFA